MPAFKKILYATDLSTNSAYAFQYASEFANRYDAEIVILHVLEEIPVSVKLRLSKIIPPEEFEKRYEIGDEIESRLREFCEKVRKEDPSCSFRVLKIEVCEGDPAAKIIEKAGELECGIIIMGSHGRGILGQTILGGVANRVLRNSRIPVFIIPLPKEASNIGIRDI